MMSFLEKGNAAGHDKADVCPPVAERGCLTARDIHRRSKEKLTGRDHDVCRDLQYRHLLEVRESRIFRMFLGGVDWQREIVGPEMLEHRLAVSGLVDERPDGVRDGERVDEVAFGHLFDSALHEVPMLFEAPPIECFPLACIQACHK